MTSPQHEAHQLRQSQYREIKCTESVPTKSGNEATSHFSLDAHNSDGLQPTSRPSSSGEDLAPEDKDFIEKNAAKPSDTDLDVSTKTFTRPPTEDLAQKAFKFGSLEKSSQPMPPASFEKSNQEHQAASDGDLTGTPRHLLRQSASPQRPSGRAVNPRQSTIPVTKGHKRPGVSAKPSQPSRTPVQGHERPKQSLRNLPGRSVHEPDIFCITKDLSSSNFAPMTARTITPATSVVLTTVSAQNPDAEHEVQTQVENSDHHQPIDNAEEASNSEHLADGANKSNVPFKQATPAEQTPIMEYPASASAESTRNAGAMMTRPMSRGHQTDTVPTATKDPVRRISHHGGASRVTKRNPRPPQERPGNGPSAPKPRISSAELFQLYNFTMRQEMSEEREEATKVLSAKETEIHHANEQNRDLSKQLHQVQAEKAELQRKIDTQGHKLSDLHAKASRMLKFVNGTGNDFKVLREMRVKFDKDFVAMHAFQDAMRNDIHDIKKLTERASTSLGKSKADHVNTMQEYIATVKTLTDTKNYLEDRLSEKVGALCEERDRNFAINQQLKDFHTQQKSIQEMLKERTDETTNKLADLHNSITQSSSHDELLSFVKKESEKLTRQGQVSVANVQELRRILDNLSSAVQKHLDDARTTEASLKDAHTDADNRVATLLESMKTNLQSQENLADKNTSLRESIAATQERLNASEANVNTLSLQISEHQTREASLREQIEQLNTTVSSLQLDRSSAESVSAMLQEANAEKGLLQQEVGRMKSENTESMANVASLNSEKTNLQQEKEELQRQIIETKRLLDRAEQSIPDFGPQKTQLEEKAKQDLEALKAEKNDQARKVALDHGGQMLRIRKEKEAISAKLAAKETELGSLKSDWQLLEKEANCSVSSLPDELRRLTSEVKQLGTEKDAAQERSQRLQQELHQVQESQRTSESTIRSQANELHQAREKIWTLEARVNEMESTKSGAENKLTSFGTEAQKQEQERQKEIADLQRDLEEANSGLKLSDELLDEQRHLVAQKDQVIADMKRKAQSQASITSGSNDGPTSNASSPSQRQDKQPLNASGTQTGTPQTKKVRRPVNRNVPTSTQSNLTVQSQTADKSSQENARQSDAQDTQPRSTSSPTSRQSGQARQHGNNGTEVQDSQQDDDDMLDLDDSQLEFEKTNSQKTTSRPTTSQSEQQRAQALGSQEILDHEGVRVRSQNGPKAISSPLSPVRELSSSYEIAAEDETQETQTQTRIKESQASVDLSGLELDPEDDYSLPSQSEHGTPKDRSRNLQGQGRKLTPLRDSQHTPTVQDSTTARGLQTKAGALPTIKPTIRLTQGSTNTVQKKVSALDSGPHNFKTVGGGKGKQARAESEEDDSGSDPISGPGNQSSRKRPAPQGTAGNKRARTGGAGSSTNSGSRNMSQTSQRPSSVVGRNSQGNRSRAAQTPSSGPVTRRSSTRSNREQSMMNRFNDEIISSPRVRRG